MYPESPEYLYHYTSISTLALILSEKRIRFNSLDNVDDLLESSSTDLANLGRLYFVSCWSSSDDENIPLWSMYTPNMSGVRIKLPAKMFKTHVIKPQSNDSLHVHEEIKESPLSLEELITDKYLANPFIYNSSQFLRKIEYTSDESKLHPIISSKNGVNTDYALGNIGIYKRPEWKFQSEWRYRIMFFPRLSDNTSQNIADHSEKFAYEIHNGLHRGLLPFNSFYLNLDDTIIHNIEITLGPKMNEGDKKIVDLLVNKYCNNPAVYSSNLKIR